MNAKAKIDLSGHVIELEGSEDFVSKYLEEFKGFIIIAPRRPAESEAATSVTIKPHPHKKSPKENPKKTKKTAKSILPEKFDISRSDSKPAIEEIFDKKAPGDNNGNRIAVIAFYISRFNNQAEFSEGNIEYAYRILKLKGKPVHLRQVIINNKNERDFFETGSDENHWKLTRVGEIFVDEKLPPAEGGK